MNAEGKDGFQKGRSGNPGVRPREIGEVRHLASQAIEALEAIMKDTLGPASARVAASEAILNRGWGRPTQMIAGDDESGPLQLVVSWSAT